MRPSIQALVDTGHFAEAAEALDAKPHLSTSERVLRAYLKGEMDGPGTAVELVEALEPERLGPRDKAMCLDILGRAAGYNGNIDEGLKLLQRSSKTLESLKDAVAFAAAEAKLTLLLLGWRGIGAALPGLPRLRRLVTKAGDPRSSVMLHHIYAELEMKRQQWANAGAHLTTAAGLLRDHPHLVSLARLALLRANLAALRSRPREALRLSSEALQHYEASGNLLGQCSVLANISHVSLALGDHETAAKSLHRSRALTGSGLVGIGLDGTELEIALATDDAAKTGALAQALFEQSHTAKHRYSPYGLSYLHSHAKWLLRTGRPSEAARFILAAEADFQNVADHDLRTRANLLLTECLGHDQRDRAVAHFSSLALDYDQWPLELIGQASRVAGCLTAGHQPLTARAHFARAARVFASAGFANAEADVSRTVTDLLGADVSAAIHRDSESNVPARVVPHADLLESVALVGGTAETVTSFFDLIDYPVLAGQEILRLICDSDAASSAALIAIDPEGESRLVACSGCDPEAAAHISDRSDVVRMPLGVAPEGTIELVVSPPGSPAARITLTAVQRLVRYAVALRDARARESERTALWPEDTAEQQLGMIFAAENMSELVTIVRRVATSNVTVLFTGETGTGKELLARALHETSPRRDKPFIPFNCSAVAKDMLASQLFGYRRGAFTGAQEAFQGVIRAAAGGTLLLDEIGELSLDVQPKLLRFLESGEVHPLGEPRPLTVDVRVVAATNANLEQLVADGRFREDLFYRLNVVRLQVPALRERREEIPLLAQHFLDTFSRESGKTGLRFAEETMEYLVLYKWPGNVRQLANEVRRMVALAESAAILMPEHLSEDIASSRRTMPASERERAPTEFVVRMDQPISAATEHLERSMIQYALKLAGGRVEDAAQLLGLSRKGLYLKRHRLLMADADPAEAPAKRAASE